MASLAPINKLRQRGIEAAAQQMGWQADRNGWQYPVLDATGCIIGQRWKAYNSSATLKYRWTQRLPGDSSKGFYHVGVGLIDAIASGGSVLHFVNGEPAVLTMLAAGIENAVCVFGEGLYPDSIADTLKSWHVSKVVYYADKDATGQSSAGKLSGLLAASGIALECRAMLDTMPDKSDVNDLWQSVGFNVDAFTLVLAALPIFTPLIQRETKPLKSIKATHTNSDDKWSEFVDSEVMPALDRVGIRQGKKHGSCINPAHDDRHPSARISERGVYVCTCGKYSLKTVAGWLRLDFKTWVQAKYPEAHKPRNNQPKQHTQPSSNILSFEPLPPARQPRHYVNGAECVGSWPVGVPDSIRSAALNYLPKGAAITYEIWNQAVTDGMIDLGPFSCKQFTNAAKSLGYALSDTTLFSYLKNALEAGLIRDLGIDSYIQNTIPKNRINSTSPGRKAHFYSVVTADELHKVIEDHAYPRFIERYHPTEGDSVIATMYESVVDAIDTTEDKSALALELAAVIDASASTQETRKTKAGIYARRAFERFQKSLDNPHSSSLPDGWEIADESDYIVAYAHALGAGRERERISLNEWSRLLGISVNSVPTYLKRAGLGKVEQPQYEYVHIEIAENIVKEVSAKAKSQKAYPRWIVVRDQYDNEITSTDYDPATAAKVAKQYRVLGCKVEIKMQAANAYQVVSESPVEVQKTAVERVAPVDHVIIPVEPDFEVVRPFREPRLNPAWVVGQFKLVLQQKGRWLDNWRFIDQYGEIVETKEPRALAELIIGRPIASNITHTAIESEMTAGGWRKVSA